VLRNATRELRGEATTSPDSTEFNSMSWILRGDEAYLRGTHWFVGASFRTGLPRLELSSKHDNSNKILRTMNIRPLEPIADRHRADSSASPLPFGDAYVRQNDLIASFPERSPWRFGYQVDVRAVEQSQNESLCLEVWISVQTTLLDSHPMISVEIADESFDEMSAGIWTDAAKRTGVIMHPLDLADCRMNGSTKGLTMRIFGSFMEKGVIRRMRFRWIATSTSQPSHAFWEEQYQEFSGSPLPLTT
jgi:hypothetical protein